MGGAIVGAIGAKNKNAAAGGVGLIGCAQCLGGLAWLITGSVLRFRTTGCICSGDGNYWRFSGDNPHDYNVDGILVKSGQFMKVWLIICYCLMGCICCLAVLAMFFGKKG